MKHLLIYWGRAEYTPGQWVKQGKEKDALPLAGLEPMSMTFGHLRCIKACLGCSQHKTDIPRLPHWPPVALLYCAYVG